MSAPPSPKVQSLGRLLVMQLHMVLRTFKLHEPTNQALLIASENLRDTINTLWAAVGGAVRLQLVDGVAYLNDTRLRLDATLESHIQFLQAELARRELGGVAFARPVDAEALRRFIQLLTREVSTAEDVRALRESLEQFKELAMELLEPQFFVDEEVAVDDEVKVDRRTFALQAYAKAIVAIREGVRQVRDAEAPSSSLSTVRIVQDLVDIGSERVNFLLKLSAIKTADDYAYTHAANTCVLSLVLGRALGVSRLELVDLGLAGLYANIGFATLPPELLDRERALTASERKEIHLAMLRQVRSIFQGTRLTDSLMRRVVVAYEHHLPYRDPEHGSVNPLHPFSRIVAVAGAFDALTTRRPWRDGYPADEALEVLRKEAGRRFDPLVVRLLVNLMGLYPLGALVELESGEVAVVYHSSHDPASRDRPWVKLLRTSDGAPVKKTVIRNLAQESGEGGRIQRLLKAQEIHGVDPGMFTLN
ncbi:MAG: HD domain-containing phosphohydrolase [Myxococcota bacterium]